MTVYAVETYDGFNPMNALVNITQRTGVCADIYIYIYIYIYKHTLDGTYNSIEIEIFVPDRHHLGHSTSYTKAGLNRSESGVNHTPLSSDEIKERVVP
jgi:hypothetical protein